MPAQVTHQHARTMLALAGVLACVICALLIVPSISLARAGTIHRNGSIFAAVDSGSSRGAGDAIGFTTNPQASSPFGAAGSFGGIDLGSFELPPPKLGVTEKRIAFKLNKRDKEALVAAQRAERARILQAKAYGIASDATARIIAIETLLNSVEQDEEQLREAMQARAVQRYKDGGSGDLAFLLSGDGVSDLIDRSRLVSDRSRADTRNARQLAVTTARLDELTFALHDLRDQQSNRAVAFGERADRLDGLVASASRAHMEAIDPAALEKGAGSPGQWIVMGGAFDVPLFMPMSPYDGGARTPRRAPTADQVARVLSDPRIELDASGVGDVRSGQVDGRLLDALSLLAVKFGTVKVTSLKSDHGTYTASGNISEHSYGCAADIGTIGSTYIDAAAQVPGGEVELAVRFLMSLASVKPDLAPHQVISLFALGGASLHMGDHHDHIHLGYSC